LLRLPSFPTRRSSDLDFPFTAGLEVAGEVIEVGAEVSHLRPGQRVLAVLRFGGGYAEEIALDADAVVPIPDGMDFITAAAFPVRSEEHTSELQSRENL